MGKGHSSTCTENDALDRGEEKWKDGTDYGKVSVWVESPGTIEAKLRSMADDYGMDY